MKKSDPTLVVSAAQTIKGQAIDIFSLNEDSPSHAEFFHILNAYALNMIHLLKAGGGKIS